MHGLPTVYHVRLKPLYSRTQTNPVDLAGRREYSYPIYMFA